jgi:GT2 family glycosyltransferase
MQIKAGTRSERVPIMILNWNGWEDTFTCLRSICYTGENHAVWLVDNGSDRDRSSEARAIYPDLRVLRWDANYGWSGGYNRALKLAVQEGYEFAYLLNNDCTVTPGFIRTTVDAARTDERIAAVGSRFAYANHPGDLLFDGQYYPPGVRKVGDADGIRFVTELSGAGLLLRLRALQQEGYFDERFFCYGEDSEWYGRVTSRGWLLAVAAGSLVIHAINASDINRNASYYLARNGLLLLRCRGKGPGSTTAHLYRILRQADEARRRGEIEGAHALSQAAWDGIRGCWGKRSEGPPTLPVRVLAHGWPVRQGAVRRKAAALTGFAAHVRRRHGADTRDPGQGST